jgi:hypothetical protein
VEVGDRLVGATGLAAGESDHGGVAVGGVPSEIAEQNCCVRVDGELEQGGEPGGTFARAPDHGAEGGPVRCLYPDVGIHHVAAAIVFADERGGQGADLAVGLRDLDGAEPGNCVGDGDGGVGWVGRGHGCHAQRAGDQRSGAIIQPGEPLAKGAGEGPGEADRRVGLELLRSEIDLVLGVEGAGAGCRVASSRLGIAQLGQGRAGLGRVTGQELEPEQLIDMGDRVAISVDGDGLGG